MSKYKATGFQHINPDTGTGVGNATSRMETETTKKKKVFTLPPREETAQWIGYVLGMQRACNKRPTIPFGIEGANVWGNIRAQIKQEIEEVQLEHGI